MRNASSMSSILVICVKIRTLCPPDFRSRSSVASACSFPQSNCTNRRSGKNSCWRTCARRRGASAGAPTFCVHTSISRRSARTDALGALHAIVGVGALAFGIANINEVTKSTDSLTRVALVFTAVNNAGAFTKGPAPNVRSTRWQWCAGCRTVHARRRSEPYTGTRRAASAAHLANRAAVSRRSIFAAAALASAKRRTAASAFGVMRPILCAGVGVTSANAVSTSSIGGIRRSASAHPHESPEAYPNFPPAPALTSSMVNRCNPLGANHLAMSGSSCDVLAAF